MTGMVLRLAPESLLTITGMGTEGHRLATLDHIILRSRGGSNEITNLVA